VKAVAWLRARALGCRHQVPPHPHPQIEPFDPSMCASVLHSVPELGGGRHRPTGPFAQFRADIQGAIPKTRGQPRRFLGGLEPPARLGLSLPHWRHQFRMQRRDARAWNRCRQVRDLDTSLIFGPSVVELPGIEPVSGRWSLPRTGAELRNDIKCDSPELTSVDTECAQNVPSH